VPAGQEANFTATNQGSLGQSMVNSVSQIAAHFLVDSKGYNSSDYGKYATSVLVANVAANQVAREFNITNGATNSGMVAAIVTITSKLLDDPKLNSSEYMHLYVQSTVAFIASYMGASAAAATAMIPGVGPVLAPVVAALVTVAVNEVLGKVVSAVYKGRYFKPGEYSSRRAAEGQLYPVRTIEEEQEDGTIESKKVMYANTDKGHTLHKKYNKSVDMLVGGEGGDNLLGDDQADLLVGNGSDDFIDARGGNDTLVAGSGDDVLVSRAGNDTILAGSGDDYVEAGEGDDIISGDTGNDIILAQTGNDNISSGDGNDIINAGIGNDFVDAGFGDDTIHGGDGHDEIDGNVGNDVIYGGLGRDRISGGGGDDYIMGDDGENHLRGNSGSDVIVGGKDNDVIYGGDHADYIAGDQGDDILVGELGADYIEAGKGNDLLVGGLNDDILLAGAGDDNINGGAGDDLIIAGTGADNVVDNSGNEVYLFSANDGLTNKITDTSGIDAVSLLDINASDLFFTRSNNNDADLVISNNNNFALTISSHFNNNDNRLEFLETADGKLFDLASIYSNSNDNNVTNPDQINFGASSDDFSIKDSAYEALSSVQTDLANKISIGQDSIELSCSVSIEDNFLHSEREAVMYRYLLSEKHLWDIYYTGEPARHRKPVASYKIVKRV
jgi:Ca2+-binding RTX toxin-like protein